MLLIRSLLRLHNLFLSHQIQKSNLEKEELLPGLVVAFLFLMDRKGVWRISPAYDMCYAYSPGNKWISRHQMTINGKSIDVTDDDLIQCGMNMGLNKRKCMTVIEETKNVILNWMAYAEKAGITEERAEEIKKICSGAV